MVVLIAREFVWLKQVRIPGKEPGSKTIPRIEPEWWWIEMEGVITAQ
jgi:hypothetical protein